MDQICFVSFGDAIGGSTRVEQAQVGYVIMFADMALLAALAAPVTFVSWRSHRICSGKPWVCLRRSPKVIGYVHSGERWRWA